MKKETHASMNNNTYLPLATLIVFSDTVYAGTASLGFTQKYLIL